MQRLFCSLALLFIIIIQCKEVVGVAINEEEQMIDFKNFDAYINSIEVSNSIVKIISKEVYQQYLQSIKIPLTQLSSGFYFITLYLNDGTRMTKKIVKN